MHPEHASHEPNPARVGLMRGILVIVTAVAVGAFVLSRAGFDDSSAATVAGADDPEAAAGLDGAALDPATDPAVDNTADNTADDATGQDGGSPALGTIGADGSTGSTVGDASDDGTAGATDGGGTGAGNGAGSTQTTATTAPDTTDSSGPAGPDIAGPAQIAVLVLNAEGTKGIAGQGSEALRDAGYQVLAPRNATNLSAESRVLYTGDFEAEAVSVATALGSGAEIVAPLDPANPPLNDVGEAMVVVVIGQDQAFGL